MSLDRTEVLIITNYKDTKRFYIIHKLFIEELAERVKRL